MSDDKDFVEPFHIQVSIQHEAYDTSSLIDSQIDYNVLSWDRRSILGQLELLV